MTESSWWIGLDRSAFFQQLREELPRIKRTAAGKVPMFDPLTSTLDPSRVRGPRFARLPREEKLHRQSPAAGLFERPLPRYALLEPTPLPDWASLGFEEHS